MHCECIRITRAIGAAWTDGRRRVVDGRDPKSPRLPRLLVVTDTHLVLLKEDPAYFALVPLNSLPRR